MKKKKSSIDLSKKCPCTICGGDAFISFKGILKPGEKPTFKKDDRPCLSCAAKRGHKLF